MADASGVQSDSRGEVGSTFSRTHGYSSAADEFLILGPLEVVLVSGRVEIGGPKERIALAALAAHVGETVSADRLADALWGDNPPRSSVKAAQNVILRLRRALGRERIETRAGGYLLRVAPDAVDARRFDRLVRSARQSAKTGDLASAAADFSMALGLWRGKPLPELADWLAGQSEVARLEELRRCAEEELVDIELAVGHHADCVPRLETMVAVEPLREPRWGQLMVALYRSGRQSDALRAYQRAREWLATELGIAPSKALSRLEEAILSQKPEVDWEPSQSAGPTAIDTLPSGVVTFLLTDIVGSTALWDRDSKTMAEIVGRHDRFIQRVVEANGGAVLKPRGEGDSTFSVFSKATDALVAALSAQLALAGEAWPPAMPLRVRMALHTGEAFESGGDYFGPTVNRAARIRSLAVEGGVVVSQSTSELVRDDVPEHAMLVDLGSHVLSGLARRAGLRVGGSGTPRSLAVGGECRAPHRDVDPGSRGS